MRDIRVQEKINRKYILIVWTKVTPMKLATVIITLIAAVNVNTDAFSAQSLLSKKAKQNAPLLRMVSEELSEVEKLRAAAAKAREEAAKLAKELGKDVNDSGNAVSATAVLPNVKTSVSIEDIKTMTASINFDDASSQIETLDSLVAAGDLTLWKKAVSSSALRTFPVSLRFLDSRTNGQITVENLGFGGEGDVSMDDFKYATLGVTLGASVLGVLALNFLPENIGATVCYFLALLPVLFLGIGSTAPGLIAGAIQSTRGSADTQEQKLDRVCRHEAGHFLCGYLCGLPIKGYTTNDSGIQCVEFHPSREGPVTGREFSQEEIAALSCVAMSGSVAEVLALGNAKGGDNDLIQLDLFFRQSAEFIGAQKQQDLTRWGALASYNLINENRSKYDELVRAFKDQKAVSECIAILESR